jgi:hypothetical protein
LITQRFIASRDREGAVLKTPQPNSAPKAINPGTRSSSIRN